VHHIIHRTLQALLLTALAGSLYAATVTVNKAYSTAGGIPGQFREAAPTAQPSRIDFTNAASLSTPYAVNPTTPGDLSNPLYTRANASEGPTAASDDFTTELSGSGESSDFGISGESMDIGIEVAIKSLLANVDQRQDQADWQVWLNQTEHTSGIARLELPSAAHNVRGFAHHISGVHGRLPFGRGHDDPSSSVPEPQPVLMSALGITAIGLGALRRRKHIPAL
jgi:hypothetical protein